MLVRPLGVGGFGEVWLARNAKLTSLVGAVKFCLGQQARDIQHESGVIDRVMQAGPHANIVPLLDVALEGEVPWLMYEYVPGGDLADFIRTLQARSPAERCKQAIAALRQIASAVAHFHKLTPPVVHRDLKPNNVLMSDSAPRITDFGIGAIAAKAALDDDAHNGANSAGRLMSYMKGSHTPLYASPQQRKGDDPDPRDDIHALGVIAFQMLTGDLTAAPGSDLEHDLRDAGAPDDLIVLIAKSVAQKADRRPKDAGEWGAALSNLVPTAPVINREEASVVMPLQVNVTAPPAPLPPSLAPRPVVAPSPATPRLSRAMVATLTALDGQSRPITHRELEGITGRAKGNQLRELLAMGYTTTTAEQGVRGYVYAITPAGRAALAAVRPQ